jgi:hypothetical protein
VRRTRVWGGAAVLGLALLTTSCGGGSSTARPTGSMVFQRSICPRGSDGALSGVADGEPTPEAAIARGDGFPPGTPTSGYVRATDLDPSATVPDGSSLYLRTDDGELVSAATVVPIGRGWAVSSVVKCH